MRAFYILGIALYSIVEGFSGEPKWNAGKNHTHSNNFGLGWMKPAPIVLVVHPNFFNEESFDTIHNQIQAKQTKWERKSFAYHPE